MDRFNEYKRNIETYLFSVIELRDAEFNEAVQVFTRINTTGLELSLFQIMCAKTYDEEKNFNMQELYEEFEEELKDVNYESIRPRVVLDVLSMIITKNCTREAILNLEKQKIIEKWDDTLECIKQAIDYFRMHFKIPVSEVLPYDSLIIPIAYFFHLNDLKDPNKSQRKY